MQSASAIVEQSLSALHLLLLFAQLLFFNLGLLPVFVSNLGQDPSMSFSSFIFVFLVLLVSFLDFLLDLFFSLLYQRVFKPLFEFHVAHFLPLLLFKTFFLVLLDFDKLFVVQVHYLFVFPLEHLVGTVLHSHRLFFLFLDQSFQQVSLGLDDELLTQLYFMVLLSSPLLVTDFEALHLHLEDFSSLCLWIRIGFLGRTLCSMRLVVNLLIDQVINTCSFPNSMVGNVNNVFSVSSHVVSQLLRW